MSMPASEMTGEFEVLRSMMAWIARNQGSLMARGLLVVVAPPRAGRPKQAVSLSVDSGHLISQLVVWDTGEAQLLRANALSGEDTDECRQVGSQAELDRALADLLAWTSAGEAPGGSGAGRAGEERA
jgi:hypothetical protein